MPLIPFPEKGITLQDVAIVLKQRYVTVFLDLPISNPIQVCHEIALREVENNIVIAFDRLSIKRQ
jgi:hypothetical protein